MRVSAQELGGDGLDDAAEIKQARLFRHARVKDDLQQEVAKLLAQIFGPCALDRVGHFVGLFDGERGDRGEGLLDVPRAAGDGIAQRHHDVDEATNVAGGLHGQDQTSVKPERDYWAAGRSGATALLIRARGARRPKAKSLRVPWACRRLSSSPAGLRPNAKCRPDRGPRYGRKRPCRHPRWRRSQTPWRRRTISLFRRPKLQSTDQGRPGG